MIRFAEPKDAPRISALLKQVLEVHAAIRPDLFQSGTQKYSEAGVLELLNKPDCTVFVETDANDAAVGYAICYAQTVAGDGVMVARRELYVDDLCVDERMRRTGVATRLFARVKQYAKDNGFDWITLNVWNGNDSAMAFYRAAGFAPRRVGMELPLS